jgi:hypothetical protein
MPDRPVRIPRAAGAPSGPVWEEPTEPPVGPPSPSEYREEPERSVWASNSGAVSRSWRVFLSFLVSPGILWVAFFVLERTSSDTTLHADWVGPSLMGAIWAIIAVTGFLLTLLRTPRGFRRTAEGNLRIRTFFGGEKVQPLGEGSRRVIREHYRRGPFSPVEVDLVELDTPGVPSRRWLVDSDLLDEIVPR